MFGAAENLKLPFLSPYLDSIGTNFRHGANFAAAGSSILPPGFSPFPLGTQISQFLRYKSRMTALYNSGKFLFPLSAYSVYLSSVLGSTGDVYENVTSAVIYA